MPAGKIVNYAKANEENGSTLGKDSENVTYKLTRVNHFTERDISGKSGNLEQNEIRVVVVME